MPKNEKQDSDAFTESILKAVRTLRARNILFLADRIQWQFVSREQPTKADPDFDQDVFQHEWEQEISKRPWRFSIYGDDSTSEGSLITILVRPDTKSRDELNSNTLSEYRYGYELPLLLVNETLSKEQALRLGSILPTIAILENFPKQPEPSANRLSLAYLATACLRAREISLAAFGATPLLSYSAVQLAFEGSFDPESSIPRIIQAVQKLEPQEQEHVEFLAHSKQAPIAIDDLIRLWDRFAYQLFEPKSTERNTKQGFNFWLYLPSKRLSWPLYEEFMRGEGSPFETPQVEIDYDIAEQILPHVQELRELCKTGGGILPINQGFNSFCKEGKFWTIHYDGSRVFLKDLKGLIYIQILLKTLGKHMHVSDILKASGDISTWGTSESLIDGDSSIGFSVMPNMDSEPLVDQQTRVQYRAELKKLRQRAEDKVSAGKPDEAQTILDEVSEIEKCIRKVTQPGGRTRKETSDQEKARVAVKNNIETALSYLKDEHPSLWRHLKNSLQTGKDCIYSPESDPEWHF